MGIRAKGGLGKLTGVATVTRKDGTKEEVKITKKVTPEHAEKIFKSVSKPTNNQ